MALTLDQFLQNIGSLGCYQAKLLSLLGYILVFNVAYPFLIVTFLIIEPPWKCVTNSSSCTLAGEYKPGDEHYDFRCNVPRSEWYFSGERTSVITEFELVCDKSSLNLVSPTLFFVGTLVSDFCCGILSDKFGRKPIMIFFGTAESLFALFAALSPKFWMYSVCRFFIGFCYVTGYLIISTAATFIPMYTLCTEFVGVDRRHVSGTVIWMSWACTVMMLGGIAYFLHDFRSVTLAGAVPGFLITVMWCFIPESIRYLLLNDKTEKAYKTLRQIAKTNKRKYPSEPLDLSFLTKDQKKGSVQDLFRTWKMLHITIILFIVLLIATMVYLTVTISSPNLGGNMYLNVFLFGAVEIPANILAMWLIQKYGRRNAIAGSLMVAGIGGFLVVLLTVYHPGNHIGYTVGRIGVSLISKMAVGISYITLVIFAAECYPSVIRSTGLAVSNAGVDTGGLISPFVVKLDHYHPLLPYGVIGGSSLLAGILCLTLKETGNKPTRETLNDDFTMELVSKEQKTEDCQGDNKLDKETTKSFAIIQLHE